MSATASEPVLRIENLQKSYGSFSVLNNLQLEISEGSVHGLVGLNGSGKTTTLECALGLQGFNSGSISILGREPGSLHLHHGRVVSIFDSPSLNPNLTVNQSLQQAALLAGLPGKASAGRASEMESLLGITKFSDFKIRKLSLGNKRRASIAHGLMGNPDLVLLDEPFNGLDAGGVDDVLDLIATLNQEKGMTFLLSSHQLPYLERVCSHIAILHKGEIIRSDSKTALLDSADSTIRIRTTNNTLCKELLEQENKAEVAWREGDDFLSLTNCAVSSEDINTYLVGQGVGVSELIQQRASLDTLFRQLTSEGEQ